MTQRRQSESRGSRGRRGGTAASPDVGSRPTKADSRKTTAARESWKRVDRVCRQHRRARPGAEAAIHTPPPPTDRERQEGRYTVRAHLPTGSWTVGRKGGSALLPRQGLGCAVAASARERPCSRSVLLPPVRRIGRACGTTLPLGEARRAQATGQRF